MNIFTALQFAILVGLTFWALKFFFDVKSNSQNPDSDKETDFKDASYGALVLGLSSGIVVFVFYAFGG